ncbi:MAG: hypothetical protein RLZZ06_283 [Actinomycetota bacterium]|jgi:hypothetical protein
MNLKRPIQFNVALVVAAIETAVSAAVTAFFLWGLLSGQSKVFTAVAMLTALFALTTVFLAAATFALYNLKRWGRSAIIFWQLIQISLGYGTMDGKLANYPLAIFIFAVSGATFILLLTKKVNALFKED